MSDALPKIRLRVQPSPHDPDTLRILLDTPVQAETAAMRFDGPDAGAPLSVALFAISGVQQVEVDGAVIHIRKQPSAQWDSLKLPVAAAIRAVLTSAAAPLGDGPAAAGNDADTAMMQTVRALLESRINPAIAGHGGHIDVDRVTDGTVYLRMSGGCQGCAASQLTLRGGVERQLRAALPDLRDVVDVTDHGAGAKPFYAGSGAMQSAIPDDQAPPDPAIPLADRLRQHLEALPPAKPTISYGALARAFGMWLPGSVAKVTRALEDTMHEDARAGRPFIAARAISRARGSLPGKGFFELASALSRGPGAAQTDADFHASELQRLARG